jgi:hypothetical protein
MYRCLPLSHTEIAGGKILVRSAHTARRTAQWVYPIFPGMGAAATATQGELAASKRVFGHGCELVGCQTDPVYYAPAAAQAEIAIIGRSNCGKSTLLNSLVGTHASSTSKRPGHTDRLRFYKLGSTSLHLVDLPGYGYAAHRQSSLREAWMDLISSYLHDRGSSGGGVLRRVLLLLDARCVCPPLLSSLHSSATYDPLCAQTRVHPT